MWWLVLYILNLKRLARMKKRAQGVSCETLSERSSDQSVSSLSTISSSRKNGRKKGKISNAMSKMRDAYVNCMLNAATVGDCSALVYGNGYCGNDFQFKGSYMSIDEQAAYIRSMSQRSAR